MTSATRARQRLSIGLLQERDLINLVTLRPLALSPTDTQI